MRVATAYLVTAMAIPCSACPFCGVVGESLSQRRDRAAVLAIGESAAPAGRDRTGLPIQAMTVLYVLRGDAESPAETVVARVPGPIGGTALIFADADAEVERQDIAKGGMRGGGGGGGGGTTTTGGPMGAATSAGPLRTLLASCATPLAMLAFATPCFPIRAAMG